jgi:hypothetical protein
MKTINQLFSITALINQVLFECFIQNDTPCATITVLDILISNKIFDECNANQTIT